MTEVRRDCVFSSFCATLSSAECAGCDDFKDVVTFDVLNQPHVKHLADGYDPDRERARRRLERRAKMDDLNAWLREKRILMKFREEESST